MLRDLAWQATDNLTRAQLTMFNGLSDQIQLTEADRRRELNLDVRSWNAWIDFLSDGPLPAQPAVPDMLRRIGESAFRLSMRA